jgi:molybdopterin/thiamine biosynthesis adenylyltransferase
MDDDVFLPENICRNELSWDSVGLHKAEAVREELALISSDIDVQAQVRRLVGQESSLNTAAVLKSLSVSDLIIDVSANPDVFLIVAAIARTNRRPLCWGEVFAGGIGGLIARARPNVDPHPLAVKNGIVLLWTCQTRLPNSTELASNCR